MIPRNHLDKKLKIIIFTSICFAFSLWPVEALAQDETDVTEIIQFDLDEDNNPDLTVIYCSFISEHDRIFIYDQAGNMRTGIESLQVTDFSDDVWIFDAGADGTAQLIIDFAREGDQQVAYLYDDLDGDQGVSFKVIGDEILIEESQFWHVKAVATPSWTLSENVINPEINFFVDGPVLRYLEWGEANPALEWARNNIKTDGIVDWEIELVDQNQDGITDYQLQRLRSTFPSYATVFRSTLYVNKTENEPSPYTDAIFWPLLVSSHDYETYRYFDHPAVIAINWQEAKIDRVGILGYPTEEGYHINSRVDVWEKNTLNYADFENPMAYYDLANDRDGMPELFIRFEVFRPRDPYFLNGRFPDWMTQVEYAWDSENDGKWNYELGLGGIKPIETSAEFADFSVQTVPFEIIPSWVTDNKWDAATWVAAENGGYWNSEGMAEWSIGRGYAKGKMIEPSGLRDKYLVGHTDVPPTQDYSDIKPGFRGEYAFEFDSYPWLYFSPIDQRLHLLGAQRGIWNIDNISRIELSNLDGDSYLDQWQYYENDKVRYQINLDQDYLIYSGNGEVRIKKIKMEPSLFETLPPRNQNELLALNEKMGAHGGNFDFVNTESYLAQFVGPEMSVADARLRDYRTTLDGFRFVLELGSDFSNKGMDWLNIPKTASGEYIVSFDSSFNVQPLSPPVLDISFDPSLLITKQLTAFQPGELQVILRNDGLEDAHTVVLTVGMALEGHELYPTEPYMVTVLSGEILPVYVPWTPEHPGQWTLLARASLYDRNGVAIDEISTEQAVNIKPAPDTSFRQEVSAFGLIYPWQALLLLSSIVIVGCMIGWVLTQQLKRETEYSGLDTNRNEVE